jgi:hypothetical protein
LLTLLQFKQAGRALMTPPGFAAMRAALLFVALISLAGCGENHVWRQKMVLEVETPAGIVSGGSVTEMTVRWFGGLDRMSSEVNARVRGEASFVEIAPGRFLFALFKDGEAFRTAEVFREASDNKETRPITARLESLRDSRVVPSDRYPMLVTFDDINDPKSVKLVDPANLAATFGPGFALKSITVEITDANVTGGKVGKLLEWLSQYPEPVLDTTSDPFKPNFGAKIQHGDFIRR